MAVVAKRGMESLGLKYFFRQSGDGSQWHASDRGNAGRHGNFFEAIYNADSNTLL